MDAEPAPDPTPDPTTSRTSHDVVVAFLDALQALDVDAASALMAPDISYRNVPFPAVRGPRATVAVLRSFLVLAKEFEVEMLAIAADGDTVLTERIDTFVNGPIQVGFWVCGTFEVRDGRITVWRDRFDAADLTAAIVRGLLLAPVRMLGGRRA